MAEREHFTNGRCLTFATGMGLVIAAFGTQIAGWHHWISIGIAYGVGIALIVVAAVLITRSHYSSDSNSTENRELKKENERLSTLCEAERADKEELSEELQRLNLKLEAWGNPWRQYGSKEEHERAVEEQNRLIELGRSVDGLLDPLQVQALRLADEIQTFYDKLGPAPEYPHEKQDGTKEGPLVALMAYGEKLRPYRERLEHRFELQFGESSRKLVHEFAEKGIKNSSIRITEVAFRYLGVEEEAALPSNIRMLAFQMQPAMHLQWSQ